MERTWAVMARIGFIGKNGMLIVPGAGAKVLLGEIVLSNVPEVGKDVLETEFNKFPLCKECVRCIEACPTGALNGDGTLNVPRCLSYISIEKRLHPVPEDVYEKMKLIFGCDECISCCPQNRELKTVLTPPAEKNPASSLEEMVDMNRESLQHRIKGTCLFRTGTAHLQENARTVLSNFKGS
jgi:epoxyqueuosine reductase